jgi:hypothetical protein
MATAMVLVPQVRYEKLLDDDKTYIEKLRHYETLLSNNGIDVGGGIISSNDVTLNDKVQKENIVHNDVITADNKTVDDIPHDVDTKPLEEAKEVTISNKQPTPNMGIIDQFQSKYRLYATRLLEYIVKKGENKLSWDDEGRVIYNDVVMNDSNIVDLVQHIFKRIGSPPKGIKKFRKALAEIRVPKVFLKPFLIKPPGVPSKVKKNWITY